MKTAASTLVRWSGFSAMVAGILFVIVGVAHPPNTLSSVTTGTWAIVHSLTIAVSFFGLLGIAGIYARQAEEAGWLGLAGFLLFGLWLVLVPGFTHRQFRPRWMPASRSTASAESVGNRCQKPKIGVPPLPKDRPKDGNAFSDMTRPEKNTITPATNSAQFNKYVSRARWVSRETKLRLEAMVQSHCERRCTITSSMSAMPHHSCMSKPVRLTDMSARNETARMMSTTSRGRMPQTRPASLADRAAAALTRRLVLGKWFMPRWSPALQEIRDLP